MIVSNNRIALVGSPNSGKTTLFNALTGSRQKTGNYAGVTVEKKEGYVKVSNDGTAFTLIDLPGAYSLDARTPDEAITAEVIMGGRKDEPLPDLIIAVADCTALERNLYLVLQLRELGVPMVLALTMADLARKNGVQIDKEELEKRLGVPVIFTAATKKEGLDRLVRQVSELVTASGESRRSAFTAPRAAPKIDNSADRILSRYKLIEETVRASISRKTTARDITRLIDKVVLHRFFGPLLLLFFFTAMFQAVFSLAEIPMGAIEGAVGWLQSSVRSALPEGLLQSLVADGVIAGVGSVVVFLPQILLLFAFILFFEDSGYMARAAFIMDKLMGRIGLHGRSFIPLLSSFACAIPGIMATRTIESRRDRLITILVAPLMTCSARIPVYTLLIAAFIPATTVAGFLSLQGLAMLGLYLFGIVMALLVAFVMRKTAFRGEDSSFIMELPTYKLPSLKNIGLGLWDRAYVFLRRAGTIILAVAIVLWFLASFPQVEAPAGMSESDAAAFQLENSFAGKAGKLIEPLIKPLGYDWRIGVGLLSSFAAREVIVSTLGTVYSIGAGSDEESTQALLTTKLQTDPSFSLAVGISLLVFFALACQCMSTIAVTRRETNSWRWPVVMFTYMTGLAYGSAFVAYHLTNLLI